MKKCQKSEQMEKPQFSELVNGVGSLELVYTLFHGNSEIWIKGRVFGGGKDDQKWAPKGGIIWWILMRETSSEFTIWVKNHPPLQAGK